MSKVIHESRYKKLRELAQRAREDSVMNFAVAVLATVKEMSEKENAPIVEGGENVDYYVRLSDVNDAINKCLNDKEVYK